MAAKAGGGNANDNPRLRLAMDKAKADNMPKDTIEKAVKKGTGELAGESYEDVLYEGYASGGVAVMCRAVTDNRNRTASDVRSTFSKGGGNLGETGCVAWNFETKGVLTVETDDAERAEELSMVAIESEAEDIKYEDGILEVHTTPENLPAVQKALAAEGVTIASSDISLVPKTTIALDGKPAEQTLRLLDNLEDLADVQKAFTNADFPPEVLEQYQAIS